MATTIASTLAADQKVNAILYARQWPHGERTARDLAAEFITRADKAEALNARALDLLREFLDQDETPARDCVDFAGRRETLDATRSLLAGTEAQGAGASVIAKAEGRA